MLSTLPKRAPPVRCDVGDWNNPAFSPPPAFLLVFQLEIRMRLTWMLVGAALIFGLCCGSSRGETLTSAKLAQKIGDVSFSDAAGKKRTLDDLKGTKATVVVFLSFECPVSTSYST